VDLLLLSEALERIHHDADFLVVERFLSQPETPWAWKLEYSDTVSHRFGIDDDLRSIAPEFEPGIEHRPAAGGKPYEEVLRPLDPQRPLDQREADDRRTLRLRGRSRRSCESQPCLRAGRRGFLGSRISTEGAKQPCSGAKGQEPGGGRTKTL